MHFVIKQNIVSAPHSLSTCKPHSNKQKNYCNANQMSIAYLLYVIYYMFRCCASFKKYFFWFKKPLFVFRFSFWVFKSTFIVFFIEFLSAFSCILLLVTLWFFCFQFCETTLSKCISQKNARTPLSLWIRTGSSWFIWFLYFLVPLFFFLFFFQDGVVIAIYLWIYWFVFMTSAEFYSFSLFPRDVF